ncbi:collagen-like protein, partial [Streptomyces sp. NPDC059256]
QGTNGTNGTDGAQGAPGTQGPQGTQGTTGTQGPQGTQGATGANGTQGPQGTQGTTGANGTQGTQGAQGANGTNGTQGPQGTQGATGAQGPQGPATLSTYVIRGPQALPVLIGVGVTSTANCLAGDVATGGGYDTFGLLSTVNVIENAPIPKGAGTQSGPATGWQTQASVTILGGGFQAYAVCVDQ